jgi:hypothetical protein
LEYWLNVDKPTKKCALHVKGCVFEVEKQESKGKGIGKIKKDGGWLVFSSSEKARDYFQQNWASRGHEFSERCRCLNP